MKATAMIELWKPVIRWKRFYEVSNLGRIRSVSRVIQRSNGRPMTVRSRVMRTPIGSHGYKCCNLTREGVSKTHCVHALVAAAFIGPRPRGLEVRHKNGRKINCRASNLHYGTVAQNQADSKRHGTNARGERNGAAKLTARNVRRIRRLAGSRTQADLAEEYNVSDSAISLVVSRKNLAWL